MVRLMKHTLTAAALLTALFLSPAPVPAGEASATATVRSKTHALLTTARKSPRRGAVLTLWWAWGDWEAIAAASVGPRVWGSLEEVHRARLASLLSDTAALNWLRRFGGPGTTFTFLREETMGRRRVVVTQLRASPGGGAVDLRWVLEKRGEDWRLVDLVGEGASLVETQRTSFARVLDKGGVDRLFLRLERRREELLAEVTP